MPEYISLIGREASWTLFYLMAPPIMAALVVGLVVGVVQAATSVNEMTLSFVPKIIAVFLVMGLLGPMMLDRCRVLFSLVFERIAGMAF
ncbi:MAG: flagellar biosynthetic protein FliQ [Gammaproteobacteria bacterium]|jgi:flagellar biosynthetic protein FliQ|nr:flagellar biosynthetic protein FliQ [Gammaproteobacteria bacterium]